MGDLNLVGTTSLLDVDIAVARSAHHQPAMSRSRRDLGME